MMLLGIFLLFGALSGAIAYVRGRSTAVALLAGVILGPLGLIMSASWPLPRSDGHGSADGGGHSRVGAAAYWVVVVVLAAYGMLAVFSVGFPFLLLAAALAVTAPYRRQPEVFWSAVLVIPSFIVGFILFAPLGCTSRSTSTSSNAMVSGSTTCNSVLGIDYSGDGNYRAPLAPSIGAGFVLAAAEVGAFSVYSYRTGARGRTSDHEPAKSG